MERQTRVQASRGLCRGFFVGFFGAFWAQAFRVHKVFLLGFYEALLSAGGVSALGFQKRLSGLCNGFWGFRVWGLEFGGLRF